METKYIKFEQNAVIILDDINSRSIPVKDLKICELCTLTWKKPIYHYSPSTPAKPVSPAVVEIKSRVDKPHEETGGEKSIVKDIFSELDKEVINNPESMIDTESRLKYTEIKQKYTNV